MIGQASEREAFGRASAARAMVGGDRSEADRSLLGLTETSAARIRRLLSRAAELRGAAVGEAPPLDLLRGRTVATAFFEPSTRTRTSFVLAAHRMGADTADLSASGSSVSKGETVRDTARTLEAMGVHAIVVRGKQAGLAQAAHDAVSCSVVNAGDGRHEHPTQGLLDIATLAEATGRLGGFDLSGLRVAIVGDVISSRVARSAVAGMMKLGAGVVLVGPTHLVPGSPSCLAPADAPPAASVEVEHDIDRVLPEMDAVMMLRIQFERHAAEGSGAPVAGPIASVRAYRDLCGLTVERAARMKPGALVMHPGPINRGVEIDGPVADGLAGPRSLIIGQVTWGVAVRAAVLCDCCGV
jgi:aspartate carbamoyltransferase catalytic subunit